MEKLTENVIIIILSFFLLANVMTVSSSITLTSSVPQEEFLRQCPGQEIVFTCMVRGSSTIAQLAWRSSQYIDMNDGSALQFSTADRVGLTRRSPINHYTLANLTKKGEENGTRILESTLEIDVLGNISTFYIVCSDDSMRMRLDFQLLGEPNTPQDITISQKTVTRPEPCVLLLIGWNTPNNVNASDICKYTVYNENEKILTEVPNVDGNFTLTAFQACSCNTVNISVSATNLCGREGPKSQMTMVILDHNSTDLVRREGEATTTTTTTTTTTPTSPCKPDSNCIAFQATMGVFLFLFVAAIVVIIILSSVIECCRRYK